MLTKLATRILLAVLTPKTIDMARRHIMNVLSELAAKTETPLDDALISALRRFIRDCKTNTPER